METIALNTLVRMLAQQEHVPEETIKHRLISNTLDARQNDATTLIVDAIRNDRQGRIQAAWETTPQEQKAAFMHTLYAIAGSPFYAMGEEEWSKQQKMAFTALANFITSNDSQTAVQAVNALTAERLLIYYGTANRSLLDQARSTEEHSQLHAEILIRNKHLLDRARSTDAKKNLILLDGAMSLCGVPDKTLTRDDLDQIDEAGYDWLLLFC